MNNSIVLAVLGALALAPSWAFAQSAERSASDERCVVVRERGGNVVRCRPIDVSVPVPRPFSFGLTGRSPLGYTALEDQRSFVRDVAVAVRRRPF